jgi:hypothetical protein
MLAQYRPLGFGVGLDRPLAPGLGASLPSEVVCAHVLPKLGTAAVQAFACGGGVAAKECGEELRARERAAVVLQRWWRRRGGWSAVRAAAFTARRVSRVLTGLYGLYDEADEADDLAGGIVLGRALGRALTAWLVCQGFAVSFQTTEVCWLFSVFA